MDLYIFAIPVIIALLIFWFFKSASKSSTRDYSRRYIPTSDYRKAVGQCSKLLGIKRPELKAILRNIPKRYKQFRIGKRSVGYRTISAPKEQLLKIQKTIYKDILSPVEIHPAAKGFRKGLSITDNARPHLGKGEILKIDIADFFGSIHESRISKIFENLGHSPSASFILARLCCLKGRLPQGAATSPALSNIVALEIDKKLQSLSDKHGLIYTRYADDMSFSGDAIPMKTIMPEIEKIVESESFVLKKKKTRLLNSKKRKIITGISISSGEKLTIPKPKKRELRKNIHFILTKGLKEHQQYIGSTDPVYLKRLLGYLSFWLSVEPENEYVITSMKKLKELKSD